MASTASSKTQTAKPRKRVDTVPPPPTAQSLKRGSNGSAFIRCDACSRDVPAATVDMHDCMQDAKTKAMLAKVPSEVPVSDAPLKEKNQPSNEKKQRKTSESQKAKKPKKAVKEKDPNMPKRPSTAFFLFMDEFRKTYKDANPDAKNVSAVAKDGGEKWRSMSDEEKSPFAKKAADLKEKYEAAMKEYRASKKVSCEPEDVEERCDENEDPIGDNAEE